MRHLSDRDDVRYQFLEQQIAKPYLRYQLPNSADSIGKQLDYLYENDFIPHTFQAFDCVTFVETFLAQTAVVGDEDCLSLINRLRYAQGQVGFFYRNHIMSLDWIPNNIAFFRDISTQVAEVKNSVATINKYQWCVLHSVLQNFQNDQLQNTLRSFLNAHGLDWSQREVAISYIPLSNTLANMTNLLQSLPRYSVMMVVRPNWQLSEKIGTDLHISHLGIVHNTGDTLNFYHASSDHEQVCRVPLVEYLRFCQNIPTIGGVQFYAIQWECLSGWK